MRVSQQIGWSQECKLIFELIQQTEKLNNLLPGKQANVVTNVSKQIGWSNESNLYYEWLRSLDKLIVHYGCPNCTTTSTTTVPPTTTTTTTISAFVTICDQVWATRNLSVTTYANGDPIPEVTDPTTWASLTTGAWCYYNNDPSTEATYGRLYNWYAVNDPRGLAPTGYHIPTDAEWTVLSECLGGDAVAGGLMKEIGTTHWLTPNTGATNSSGFTALPGGYRYIDGTFFVIGEYGLWWSSSEFDVTNAYGCYIYYDDIILDRGYDNKTLGYSVRIVQD